jgi:hypothetical protein
MSALFSPARTPQRKFGRSGTNGLEISPAPSETTFRAITRSTPLDECGQPIEDDCTLEQVADLLDEVYAANGLLADEMDRILGSRAAVSQSTIDRFTRLADQLRPGARARAQLSGLDPCQVLAGTKVWMARDRERSAKSASGRAASRWSGEATA